MIRFHLDENVDGAVAKGLGARGIDVTTAADAGLLSAPDEQHLAFAHLQVRVLVTHDEDFLRLHAQGTQHSGIAYCRADSRSIGQILAMLLLISNCLTAEEMRGHVEYL